MLCFPGDSSTSSASLGGLGPWAPAASFGSGWIVFRTLMQFAAVEQHIGGAKTGCYEAQRTIRSLLHQSLQGLQLLGGPLDGNKDFVASFL